MIWLIIKLLTKSIVSNFLQQNLETVTHENTKEVPKERYISAEKRQEITDHSTDYL